MINKEQVCRHFGKSSANYNNYAVVQKKMAHTLQQLANQAGDLHHILEIGCGTGFFTKLLAERYPHAHIIATDLSPDMLQVAKNNLSAYTNISYSLEDGENLQLPGQFDLIISNAAFQWFHDYQQTFRQFYHRLQPGGYLMYATFGNDTFSELHTSFKAASHSLALECSAHHGPTFISMDTLTDIGQQLGFTTKHSEEFYKEYFPTTKDFLTSVKKVGANNASYANNIVFNRHLMLSMINYYEQHFKLNEQVFATYHAIYGRQQRPFV